MERVVLVCHRVIVPITPSCHTLFSPDRTHPPRNLLQPIHYDNVVEERATESRCGYPGCGEHLADDRSAKG